MSLENSFRQLQSENQRLAKALSTTDKLLKRSQKNEKVLAKELKKAKRENELLAKKLRSIASVARG